MASAPITAAASGDNTVVAAVAGKIIRVKRYEISASGAVNAQWKSGASTALTGLLYLAAAGSSADADSADMGRDSIFETAAGQALVLNLSGAVAVGGFVDYSLE